MLLGYAFQPELVAVLLVLPEPVVAVVAVAVAAVVVEDVATVEQSWPFRYWFVVAEFLEA